MYTTNPVPASYNWTSGRPCLPLSRKVHELLLLAGRLEEIERSLQMGMQYLHQTSGGSPGRRRTQLAPATGRIQSTPYGGCCSRLSLRPKPPTPSDACRGRPAWPALAGRECWRNGGAAAGANQRGE